MSLNNQSPGPLRGVTPLAYTGNTPNMVFNTRRPTTRDFFNFTLGTWWIIPKSTTGSILSEEVWVLVGLDNHIATWIRMQGSGSSSSDILITEYDTPGQSGDHVLNDHASIVEVMGWGGGGGGATVSIPSSAYPGSGGSGSPFSLFKVPVSYLGGSGSSVAFYVGNGGAGATIYASDGVDGEPSSFGNLYLKGGMRGLFGFSAGVSETFFSESSARALANTVSNIGVPSLNSDANGVQILTPGTSSPLLVSLLVPGGAISNLGTSSASGGSMGQNLAINAEGIQGAFIVDNAGNTIFSGGSAGTIGPVGGNGGRGIDNNGLYFAGGSGGGSGGVGSVSSGSGGDGGFPGGGGAGGSGFVTGFSQTNFTSAGSGAGGKIIIIEYLG